MPPVANLTAGVGAITFAAAIVTANLVAVPAGLPKTGTEVGTAAAFFAAQGSAVAVSSMLGPIAWVASVVFGAGVVTRVRRRAPEHGMLWALAGFAGILLQNATFSGVVGLRLALATTAGRGAETLWPLHDALFTLNGTFLALALTGLTIAGRSAGLLRPWHAVLGFTAAALLFTSATLAPIVVAQAGPAGLIGLGGWLLWVAWLVAYGVALIGDDGEQTGSRGAGSAASAAATG